MFISSLMLTKAVRLAFFVFILMFAYSSVVVSKCEFTEYNDIFGNGFRIRDYKINFVLCDSIDHVHFLYEFFSKLLFIVQALIQWKIKHFLVPLTVFMAS